MTRDATKKALAIFRNSELYEKGQKGRTESAKVMSLSE